MFFSFLLHDGSCWNVDCAMLFSVGPIISGNIVKVNIMGYASNATSAKFNLPIDTASGLICPRYMDTTMEFWTHAGLSTLRWLRIQYLKKLRAVQVNNKQTKSKSLLDQVQVNNWFVFFIFFLSNS